MTTAKAVRLECIDSAPARAFVGAHHYSGRAYSKSRLHMGAFLAGHLVGVLQWGPGIDTSHSLAMVPGTRWDAYLELNRMAFVDDTPRHIESRCLAIAARLIQRHAPHIEWLVSYADQCQCGDGVSYRGAGWLLTAVRRNTTLYRTPSGEVVSDVGVRSTPSLAARLGAGAGTRSEMRAAGLELLDGYQVRYLRFLSADARARCAVPILPYSALYDTHASAGTAGPRVPRAVGARRDPDAPPIQSRLWDHTAATIAALPDRDGPGWDAA